MKESRKNSGRSSGRQSRKKDLPLTGILIVVVIILAACVAVLGWMTFRKESTGGSAQMETSADTTEKEEMLLGSASESGTSAENEAEQETGEAESETEFMTGTETEAESESKSEEPQSEVLIGVLDEEETESEMSKSETAPEESELGESELGESETETEGERLVVAIDPGHQGSWVDMSDLEPNAPGSSEMKAKATTGTEGRYSGKKEYELNLEVSLLLRTELESRGYEVIMTREDHDTAISNSERALMAYEEGGDIYVRIHANGADDSSVEGALAMVPSASNPYVGHLAEDSYLLAQCIMDGYCSKAQFRDLGIQYYDNMTGINWSKLPVMILEMGFMTNESDDLRMADAEVQKLMAEGIADGIDEYFTQKGMKENEVSAEAQTNMNLLFEKLGESYLYSAMDAGENWAVSITDLASGASGNINGEVPMKSASVIKVFIMAAIYDRVCYPATEERRLNIVESYDGELKQLITDMITVSDNNASNTLLERLGGGDTAAGMAVVNQFCQENGYMATSVGRKFLESNPSGDNYTSANDCARLLQSIYDGTCVGPEASAKMYEYLKNQTRTGKIPAGLSGTAASAANKTGELYGEYGDYVENDIAIVEDGDSAYVLCIMSGSLNDNGEAVSRIGNISRMVYDNL